MSPNDSIERRYGVGSGDERRALGGLEFVQRLVTGALPLNTMARTLGYDIVKATAGRVIVTVVPSADHLNPGGNRAWRLRGKIARYMHGTRRSYYNWTGRRLNDTGVQDLTFAISDARDGPDKS
jgi:hypothetical protein